MYNLERSTHSLNAGKNRNATGFNGVNTKVLKYDALAPTFFYVLEESTNTRRAEICSSSPTV